ncbi:MAG: UDP-N-acetylmuramoyl-tripeptide--D-alanyl-D-alanine ligase [Deltaproteobacteria bacterium]|nr:UDP-N-acetylmuramoyl-tripeptide--D-alanyl-D-alanine ligase [Deltaproteobacteria bacterium]
MLQIGEIKAITGGDWLVEPKDPTAKISGGAFDTRNLGEAEIFFAWKGENSDGHRYLNQLENSKIKLVIIERDVAGPKGVALLKVKDSLAALAEIARELIGRFKGKLITLTGSSGKTTAKTWLSHLLTNQFCLLANQGSFNNHIGCPITILNIKKEHELIILEMGTNSLGELEFLSSIAPGDIRWLINVGLAHLGKFGSRENIYRAKAEIFSNMRKDDHALVPFGDEQLLSYIKDRRPRFFGQKAPEFFWELIQVDQEGLRQRLKFHTPGGTKEIWVNHLGAYVGELLSGIFMITDLLGGDLERVIECIETLPQEKGRSSFCKGLGDSLIYDDSYNANPDSLVNMLKTICVLKHERKIAVIGNLAELEEDLSVSAAYIIERLPQELTDLILTGQTGRVLFPLIKERIPNLKIAYFKDTQEIIAYLKGQPDHQTVIGIKGSRSSHMERVVLALTGEKIQCALETCGKLMMCQSCDER